jgi:hypothetical protein
VPDRQRAITIRQRDVDDAGWLAGRGGHHGADDVENARGVADRGFDRNAGENALVGAGDNDVPPGGDGPGRNEPRQQQLQALERCGVILPRRGDAIETFGKQVGDRREIAFGGRALLTGLIDHLYEGTEANGDQKRDDQSRYGTPERRLR